MAESNTLLHPPKLPNPGLSTSPSLEAQQFSARFLSSFLYKAIFFILFIALVSFFPTQAPESVNQQSFLTRSWELIQLLLVGIAVSYGLFSRRNAEPELEKEIPWKAESPQSYVSQMLHVSLVLDDDSEIDSPHGILDESKIQIWNSRYHRNEPVVVVANGGANHAANKPLSLPVRSLKSSAEGSGSLEEADGNSASVDGSKESLDSRGAGKGTVVLPSPIPWRSRSGMMEMKEEPTQSLPPSVFNGDSGLSRTPSFRSSTTRSDSTTHSPNRSSLSQEIKAKSSEDTVKKSFRKSSPPPAPPPPPPFIGHGYSSIFDKKAVTKSFKDELKDLSRRGRGGLQSNNETGIDPKPRNSLDGSSVGKSVRTIRPKDMQTDPLDNATKSHSEQPLGYEARQPPMLPRYQNEKKKKNELLESVVVSSDVSDSEEDDDIVVVPPAKDVEAAAAPGGGGGGGGGADENEVDKKADEFIAKFREQIRLQRIDSIKKSTVQRSARNPN